VSGAEERVLKFLFPNLVNVMVFAINSNDCGLILRAAGTVIKI
jgi:hypothetical protein